MKYGIIGAGPSGLTMGLFLKQPSVIFEKNKSPGGHAGSFTENGFTFDYGPHIMFSKNKEALDFVLRTLGTNVHKCRRHNKVFYKGKLIKYPFENDLKSLPIEDNYECLTEYLNNPYKRKYKKPKNLKEWLLYHFGKGICEKYLFPYNEKVWNIPVDKLSMLWAGRIPNPPPEDIIKSAIGYETEGYLHQLYYYYPLRGGYQSISDAWAKRVNVQYNTEITTISRSKKGEYILTTSDTTYKFEEIVSTIPLQELVRIANFAIPKKVLQAIKKLIVNPMFVVSFGIKGIDKNQYTAVYFPQKEFLPNRICFPRTFSPHNAPDGFYSIQADITCKRNSKIWKMNDRAISDHVISGLVDYGIIKHVKDIVFKRVDRVPYAYVVYDRDYEKNVKSIRDWFPRQGIHLVGRFSYFEYINVDTVVLRAKEIASKLNGSNVELARIY